MSDIVISTLRNLFEDDNLAALADISGNGQIGGICLEISREIYYGTSLKALR